MLGWQASGAAPIVRGEPVLHPETIATAIQIGNPASWSQAVAARDESGGHIGEITDAKILEAYRLVAGEEGVFVEPASAASVGGLLAASEQGLVARGRDGRVHGHGSWSQGPATRDQRGRGERHRRSHRGRRRRCGRPVIFPFLARSGRICRPQRAKNGFVRTRRGRAAPTRAPRGGTARWRCAR